MFGMLKSKANRQKDLGKKKLEFAAFIGLGMAAYSKKDWKKAIDNFVFALKANADCDASVRMAIALCFFKLGSYENAQVATKRALENDVSNVDGIVMLALLEQVDATKDKDKSNRIQHRSAAADLCTFALTLDPSCATALINLANHSFCSFKTLSSETDAVAVCVDERTIRIIFDIASEVYTGDVLYITGSSKIHAVTQVQKLSDQCAVILKIDPELPPGTSGQKLAIKTKELALVVNLADRAFESSNLAAVKAESLYIKGRVYHAQKDIQLAQKFYEDALNHWPDFTLASFGLGQLILSQAKTGGPSNYKRALELFEKVKGSSPDDKDTEAYVMLLRAILHGETRDIEKIKEVATGFSYEVDLWLLQGQLRQKNQAEYGGALKCYTFAVEIMREKNIAPRSLPPIFSNIAVLQHSLGRLQEAVEYSKMALSEMQRLPPPIDPATGRALVNPNFKSSDFDGVFFTWSDSFCEVQRGDEVGSFVLSRSYMSDIDLVSNIAAGDEIIIGNILHTVESVGTESFIARSPVRIFSSGSSDLSFTVKKKIPCHNFHDGTLTLCFDYARILEDAGYSASSYELYLALLKLHPGFTECYLRVSQILHNLGKDDEACVWTQRALNYDADSLDSLAILGDLHHREGSADGNAMAKQIYERMLKQDKDDPRPLLSLGNLFLQASFEFLNRRSEQPTVLKAIEDNLKLGYKYYHSVLTKDSKHVFAANGLGIVFSQKGEFAPAREVFQKARESNTMNDDINTNLAHVHLLQNRLTEAEHAYQANLKAMTRSSRRIESGHISSLCESVAYAQFKHGRHEDSLRSLLRSMHQEPHVSTLRTLYNIAVVRYALATAIMQKAGKTVKTILNATSELELAQKLFEYLSRQQVSLHFNKEMRDRASRHFNKSRVSSWLTN